MVSTPPDLLPYTTPDEAVAEVESCNTEAEVYSMARAARREMQFLQQYSALSNLHHGPIRRFFARRRIGRRLRILREMEFAFNSRLSAIELDESATLHGR